MPDVFSPWPGVLGDNGQLAYHYTSRAAAFESILPTRLLRLGSLATMRDPLENKERAEHVIAPASWSDEDVQKLHQLERDVLENTKILSLTVDRPLAPGVSEAHAWGYARPRMWEQYAENHMGVCLVFERKHIHKQALRHLEHASTFETMPKSCSLERSRTGRPSASFGTSCSTTTPAQSPFHMNACAL